MKNKSVYAALFFISLISFNYLSSMQPAVQLYTTNECRFTKEIVVPSVGKPSCIISIKNDIFFLNGSKGYAVYNSRTKQLLLHKQRKYGYLDIAINNERTEYAISTDKNLTVYDTQTGKQLWQQKTINLYMPITFDPANRIISYIPNSSTMSIFTDQVYETCELALPAKTGPLYCHPEKFELIYSQGSAFNVANFFENISSQIVYDYHYKKFDASSIMGGIYNTNGTIIAINHKKQGCFLHNNDAGTQLFNLCHEIISNNPSNKFEQAHYASMTFHPNNTLALLSHDNTLQYWNGTTGKFLKKYLLNKFDTLQVNSSMQKRLSFSPDGKKIFIALKNKFLIFLVPFEALYSEKISHNILIRYYLLYLYTDVPLIPDIRRKIFFHYIDQLEKLPNIA